MKLMQLTTGELTLMRDDLKCHAELLTDGKVFTHGNRMQFSHAEWYGWSAKEVCTDFTDAELLIETKKLKQVKRFLSST